jgi:hypothetical protein
MIMGGEAIHLIIDAVHLMMESYVSLVHDSADNKVMRAIAKFAESVLG